MNLFVAGVTSGITTILNCRHLNMPAEDTTGPKQGQWDHQFNLLEGTTKDEQSRSVQKESTFAQDDAYTPYKYHTAMYTGYRYTIHLQTEVNIVVMFSHGKRAQIPLGTDSN